MRRASLRVAQALGAAACCLLAAYCAPRAFADVDTRDGLRVVYLSGTPYELGRQHAEALRDEVRASVSRVLGYFRSYLKIPFIKTWAANWWLDVPWNAARPFLAPDRLEELRGLAEGSGVPLQDLYRLQVLPDRTYSCSNFAAWGRATAGGRLIHMRNLDWNINAGIQDYAVVFVVRPEGKRAFVNVGWASKSWIGNFDELGKEIAEFMGVPFGEPRWMSTDEQLGMAKQSLGSFGWIVDLFRPTKNRNK